MLSSAEARASVKELIANDDVERAVHTYLETGSSEPSPDIMKVAEYALLVAPITEAVADFVDDPINAIRSKHPVEFYGVVSCVGEFIGGRAKAAVKSRADEWGLANDLAHARADKLPNYRSTILPFDKTLERAAMFSALNMYHVATANALTIHEGTNGEIDHDELVERTRDSTSLALLTPMVHIDSLEDVQTALAAYNQALKFGSTVIGAMVHYDAKSGLSVANNTKTWPKNLIGSTSVKQPVDTKIGCPFTFAPRSLRVDYYKTMVMMMEAYTAWPERVAAPKHIEEQAAEAAIVAPKNHQAILDQEPASV